MHSFHNQRPHKADSLADLPLAGSSTSNVIQVGFVFSAFSISGHLTHNVLGDEDSPHKLFQHWKTSCDQQNGTGIGYQKRLRIGLLQTKALKT